MNINGDHVGPYYLLYSLSHLLAAVFIHHSYIYWAGTLGAFLQGRNYNATKLELRHLYNYAFVAGKATFLWFDSWSDGMFALTKQSPGTMG